MIRVMNILMTTLVSATLLISCSGGGSSAGSAAGSGKAPGLLGKATSEAVFESALKSSLKADVDNAALYTTTAAQEDALSVGASANEGSYTSTYTLVDGVDEADIIKYDGDILYAVDRAYNTGGCAVCADPVDVDSPEPVNSLEPTKNATSIARPESRKESIKIYRTFPDSATAEYLTSIALDDQQGYLQGLYLPQKGRLMTLSSGYSQAAAGVDWLSPYYWYEGTVTLDVFDTSTPASPVKEFSLSIDGTLVGSRRIANKLYLITRYAPNVVSPAASEQGSTAANQSIDALTLSDIIPSVRYNDEQRALFKVTDCYVTQDETRVANSAVITSITVLSVDNPQDNNTVCYTGEAAGLYMSESNLYLLAQRYAYTENQNTDTTTIHKFALGNNGVDYRGSAQVPGLLGHSGQMDYRISEANGYLRLVSSEYKYNGSVPVDSIGLGSSTSVDHRLTILKESSINNALDVVSVLPNDAQPNKIGKPGERLYAVRFTDERAYLVTFQNIDPLYVLDLSSPESPMIAGELEVPGFSDFIHPVSDDLLLTLGKDAELTDQGWSWVKGLKIELFDVSDIAQPKSADSLSIGGRYTDSPALYDRHAFTYKKSAPESGGADRFAIPIDLYGDESGAHYSQWLSSGLQLFEIANVGDAQAASLQVKGQITRHSKEQGNVYPSYGNRRSLIDSEAVYYYDSGELWSSFWSDPASAVKIEM